MVIAWIPVVNLAVLVISFQCFKYSFYLHVLLGIGVITITLFSTIHILLDAWIYPGDNILIQRIHNIAGLVVVIWLGVQVISGIVARTTLYSKSLSQSSCILIRKIHIYLGYMIMLIAKFDYLNVRFFKGKYDDLLVYILG